MTWLEVAIQSGAKSKERRNPFRRPIQRRSRQTSGVDLRRLKITDFELDGIPPRHNDPMSMAILSHRPLLYRCVLKISSPFKNQAKETWTALVIAAPEEATESNEGRLQALRLAADFVCRSNERCLERCDLCQGETITMRDAEGFASAMCILHERDGWRLVNATPMTSPDFLRKTLI
jgi:hypothetical protein